MLTRIKEMSSHLKNIANNELDTDSESIRSNNDFENLASILLTKKLIDEENLNLAKKIATVQHQSLLYVLISQNLIDSEDISKHLAIHYHFDFIDIKKLKIENLPHRYIDPQLCKTNLIIPFNLKDDWLEVAIADPDTLSILETLRAKTSLKIKPFFSNYRLLINFINSYLQAYYLTSSTSVINIVEQILTDAILKRASDIHIEPINEHLRIRLRVDGLLHEVAKLSYEQLKPIISRLKVMANLDIAEQRRPQEGRFHFITEQKQSKDCRLSTCPTLLGEKIVIRLLNNQQQLLDIDRIGMDETQKLLFLTALTKTQGLILVTGPTGSGKTQTLYAALQYLNQSYQNILTVEDPVEIKLEGVNQTYTNEKLGLDFSAILKTFLRQDPDIIMIGEIRDQETAQTAIRAAQTGHLVLSTLHTNSAVETIARLNNIGITNYQLSSCLNLIISQRLARTLCPECKIQASNLKLWQSLQKQNTDNELDPISLMPIIYSPKGCEFCIGGYFGRTAIFEMLSINEKMQELIQNHVPLSLLKKQMQKEGLKTIWNAAIEKVKSGTTSLEEACRVIEND